MEKTMKKVVDERIIKNLSLLICPQKIRIGSLMNSDSQKRLSANSYEIDEIEKELIHEIDEVGNSKSQT